MLQGFLSIFGWFGFKGSVGFGLAVAIALVLFKLFVPVETHDEEEIYSVEEYQKLSEKYARAQSTIIGNEDQFRDALDQELARYSELQQLLKELEKQDKQPIEISEGRGTAEIEGSGEIVGGTYSDPWLDVFIAPVGDGYQMDYLFSFGIGQVKVITSDEKGRTTSIYSVWVESLKDPTERAYLGDYIESRIARPVLTPGFRKESNWHIFDLKLNLDALYIHSEIEPGIAISLASYGKTRAHDDLLFLFPTIGITEHDLYASLFRLNVGNLLPLIEDLHIIPVVHHPQKIFLLGAGWNDLEFGIGIGTSL